MNTLYSLIIKIIVILWMAGFVYMGYAVMHIPGDHPRVIYPLFQSCIDPNGARVLKDHNYIYNEKYQTNPALATNTTCYNELNQSHKQIDKLVAQSDDKKSLPKVLYEDIFRIPPPTYNCKNNAQGQLSCQVAKIDLSQL